MATPAIEAQGLSRRYGEVLAVDRVSFAVAQGEIFGFLGPNGAGKSTIVRMLTGYVPATEGRAFLAGLDIAREPSAARRRMGVVPEEANVYADLSVWENVMLMAELHAIPRARRVQRAIELLDVFELSERRRQKGRTLSKGLRQRLMLCMALVSDPEILFLDEPTSGLDVASSHLIRELIVKMNGQRGMTVFLTTHNIEEANQLCHRVAIINRGLLAAVDTPDALKSAFQARQSVEVRLTGWDGEPADLLDQKPGADYERLTEGFRVYGAEPGRLAQAIANRATAKGLRIESIATLAPSLEDVFLHLTRKRRPGPGSE
jgi:ABC-2 type transport system ATP-binding protein